MSRELTVEGAAVPPTSRCFRFAFLGLGIVLFVTAHADAGALRHGSNDGAVVMVSETGER